MPSSSATYAALFTPDTYNMRSVFAQSDHVQIFKSVLDCLGFLKLRFCLFFYMLSDLLASSSIVISLLVMHGANCLGKSYPGKHLGNRYNHYHIAWLYHDLH